MEESMTLVAGTVMEGYMMVVSENHDPGNLENS